MSKDPEVSKGRRAAADGSSQRVCLAIHLCTFWCMGGKESAPPGGCWRRAQLPAGGLLVETRRTPTLPARLWQVLASKSGREVQWIPCPPLAAHRLPGLSKSRVRHHSAAHECKNKAVNTAASSQVFSRSLARTILLRSRRVHACTQHIHVYP
jgi:hypothetical protein